MSPMVTGKDETGKDTGIVERTGTARVWEGWPPFDMRVCKFEMDEWMNACGVDWNDLKNDDDIRSKAEGEVESAEWAILDIVLG